jgi:YesN/AraC family two-component response regulator
LGASQQILNAVEGKVTHEMNDFLMKPFSAEEVKEALDAIVI